MHTATINRRIAVVVAFVLVAGCAPGPGRPRSGPGRASEHQAAIADPCGTLTAPARIARNRDRLANLQAERQNAATEGDYRIGPGDVLAVKAYELDELNQRVRVDGAGNVTLPLLNTVPVMGKTMAEVERDLTSRLGVFMYSPKVTVFIEEFRSQQVAVVGAVQRPGLVVQTNRSATVLDVISAAGGKTADATSRIYLIPAETRGVTALPTTAAAVATGEVGCSGGDPTSPSSVNGDPIVFDGNEMEQTAQATFLSIPVKGGDVVIVPGNGHFVVEGSVEKPGAYPLQSGLTLRGAIATAGGLSFPAEPSDVRIFRRGPSGVPETLQVNLTEISSQRIPDVYLHEGDVVEVASSTVKLVTYGAYRIITDLVKVGARVTMF